LQLHKVFCAAHVSNFYAFLVDIQTAVKAKEALEGHSIYEGGFCKLHLAFSRHTDLNVRVIFTTSSLYGFDITNAPSCSRIKIWMHMHHAKAAGDWNELIFESSCVSTYIKS
jgi:hypothetical protein